MCCLILDTERPSSQIDARSRAKPLHLVTVHLVSLVVKVTSQQRSLEAVDGGLCSWNETNLLRNGSRLGGLGRESWGLGGAAHPAGLLLGSPSPGPWVVVGVPPLSRCLGPKVPEPLGGLQIRGSFLIRLGPADLGLGPGSTPKNNSSVVFPPWDGCPCWGGSWGNGCWGGGRGGSDRGLGWRLWQLETIAAWPETAGICSILNLTELTQVVIVTVLSFNLTSSVPGLYFVSSIP